MTQMTPTSRMTPMTQSIKLIRWSDQYHAEARAGFLKLPLFQLMGGARTPSEIVDALSIRIVHQTLSDEDRQTLIDHARGGRRANTSLVLSERAVAARRVIADLLASRYFQAR